MAPQKDFLDPKNDLAFKKIFELPKHEHILRHFLNTILQGQGRSKIVKVEPLPPYLLPPSNSSKFCVIDVKCIDEKGHQFIVEMQNRKTDHYIQRCHYYTSLSYTLPLQSGKDHSYDALKPVIMISLLTHKIFTDDVPCVSHHIPLETVTKKCFMDTVSYTFIELPKFNETMAKQDPILAQWIDFFKNAEGLHDMNNTPTPTEIEEAYHTIEKCMWNQGELMEYERFKIAALDGVDALQTAKNGMKEGEYKAKVQMIRELHNDGIPLTSIIKASGLTKEAVEKILQGTPA
jgi:predicted transposase/invertase (TIGR01784 family)